MTSVEFAEMRTYGPVSGGINEHDWAIIAGFLAAVSVFLIGVTFKRADWFELLLALNTFGCFAAAACFVPLYRFFVPFKHVGEKIDLIDPHLAATPSTSE